MTTDHLGSPRILTDENGATISRRDFMPYGEEIARTAYSADTVRQKFTGYERDGETQLDFAQARYYSRNLARFSSADEPLLDQWEDNPQTWNLFVYVRNNPLNLIDPTGQSAQCPEGGCPKMCPEDKECTFDSKGNITGVFEPEPIKIDAIPAKKPEDKNEFRQFFTGFAKVAKPWQPAIEFITPAVGPGGAILKGGVWLFRGGKWVWGAFRAGDGVRRSLPVLQRLCFVAGTPILTRGGLKPIEEIREGDEVLSYNEKTKQNEFKTVVQTFERFAEAGRILSVKVEGEAAPLGVTHEHPFYVRVQGARSNLSSEDSDGEWVEAGNLRIGDEIRKADGSWASVESIVTRNDGAKVYNFEVADNHNYFIGQTNLLAHNTCSKIIQKALKKAKWVNGRLEAKLPGGAKIVIRRDFGANAHPIGSKYPNPVNHYNIEIHTPYRGRFKIELDAHLIVDSAGKVVDIITK